MPHIGLEIVLVKVVAVVAVIASKHVHVVIVDHAGVRVARTRTLLWVKRVDLLPLSSLDAVFVEVIDSVVSVVAAKNVDLTRMDDCGVTVTRARW